VSQESSTFTLLTHSTPFAMLAAARVVAREALGLLLEPRESATAAAAGASIVVESVSEEGTPMLVVRGAQLRKQWLDGIAKSGVLPFPVRSFAATIDRVCIKVGWPAPGSKTSQPTLHRRGEDPRGRLLTDSTSPGTDVVISGLQILAVVDALPGAKGSREMEAALKAEIVRWLDSRLAQIALAIRRKRPNVVMDLLLALTETKSAVNGLIRAMEAFGRGDMLVQTAYRQLASARVIVTDVEATLTVESTTTRRPVSARVLVPYLSYSGPLSLPGDVICDEESLRSIRKASPAAPALVAEANPWEASSLLLEGLEAAHRGPVLSMQGVHVELKLPPSRGSGGARPGEASATSRRTRRRSKASSFLLDEPVTLRLQVAHGEPAAESAVVPMAVSVSASTLRLGKRAVSKLAQASQLCSGVAELMMECQQAWKTVCSVCDSEPSVRAAEAEWSKLVAAHGDLDEWSSQRARELGGEEAAIVHAASLPPDPLVVCVLSRARALSLSGLFGAREAAPRRGIRGTIAGLFRPRSKTATRSSVPLQDLGVLPLRLDVLSARTEALLFRPTGETEEHAAEWELRQGALVLTRGLYGWTASVSVDKVRGRLAHCDSTEDEVLTSVISGAPWLNASFEWTEERRAIDATVVVPPRLHAEIAIGATCFLGNPQLVLATLVASVKALSRTEAFLSSLEGGDVLRTLLDKARTMRPTVDVVARMERIDAALFPSWETHKAVCHQLDAAWEGADSVTAAAVGAAHRSLTAYWTTWDPVDLAVTLSLEPRALGMLPDEEESSFGECSKTIWHLTQQWRDVLQLRLETAELGASWDLSARAQVHGASVRALSMNETCLSHLLEHLKHSLCGTDSLHSRPPELHGVLRVGWVRNATLQATCRLLSPVIGLVAARVDEAVLQLPTLLVVDAIGRVAQVLSQSSTALASLWRSLPGAGTAWKRLAIHVRLSVGLASARLLMDPFPCRIGEADVRDWPGRPMDGMSHDALELMRRWTGVSGVLSDRRVSDAASRIAGLLTAESAILVACAVGDSLLWSCTARRCFARAVSAVFQFDESDPDQVFLASRAAELALELQGSVSGVVRLVSASSLGVGVFTEGQGEGVQLLGLRPLAQLPPLGDEAARSEAGESLFSPGSIRGVGIIWPEDVDQGIASRVLRALVKQSALSMGDGLENLATDGFFLETSQACSLTSFSSTVLPMLEEYLDREPSLEPCAPPERFAKTLIGYMSHVESRMSSSEVALVGGIAVSLVHAFLTGIVRSAFSLRDPVLEMFHVFRAAKRRIVPRVMGVGNALASAIHDALWEGGVRTEVVGVIGQVRFQVHADDEASRPALFQVNVSDLCSSVAKGGIDTRGSMSARFANPLTKAWSPLLDEVVAMSHVELSMPSTRLAVTVQVLSPLVVHLSSALASQFVRFFDAAKNVISVAWSAVGPLTRVSADISKLYQLARRAVQETGEVDRLLGEQGQESLTRLGQLSSQASRDLSTALFRDRARFASLRVVNGIGSRFTLGLSNSAAAPSELEVHPGESVSVPDRPFSHPRRHAVDEAMSRRTLKRGASQRFGFSLGTPPGDWRLSEPMKAEVTCTAQFFQRFRVRFDTLGCSPLRISKVFALPLADQSVERARRLKLIDSLSPAVSVLTRSAGTTTLILSSNVLLVNHTSIDLEFCTAQRREWKERLGSGNVGGTMSATVPVKAGQVSSVPVGSNGNDRLLTLRPCSPEPDESGGMRFTWASVALDRLGWVGRALRSRGEGTFASNNNGRRARERAGGGFVFGPSRTNVWSSRAVELEGVLGAAAELPPAEAPSVASDDGCVCLADPCDDLSDDSPTRGFRPRARLLQLGDALCNLTHQGPQDARGHPLFSQAEQADALAKAGLLMPVDSPKASASRSQPGVDYIAACYPCVPLGEDFERRQLHAIATLGFRLFLLRVSTWANGHGVIVEVRPPVTVRNETPTPLWLGYSCPHGPNLPVALCGSSSACGDGRPALPERHRGDEPSPTPSAYDARGHESFVHPLASGIVSSVHPDDRGAHPSEGGSNVLLYPSDTVSAVWEPRSIAEALVKAAEVDRIALRDTAEHLASLVKAQSFRSGVPLGDAESIASTIRRRINHHRWSIPASLSSANPFSSSCRHSLSSSAVSLVFPAAPAAQSPLASRVIPVDALGLQGVVLGGGAAGSAGRDAVVLLDPGGSIALHSALDDPSRLSSRDATRLGLSGAWWWIDRDLPPSSSLMDVTDVEPSAAAVEASPTLVDTLRESLIGSQKQLSKTTTVPPRVGAMWPGAFLGSWRLRIRYPGTEWSGVISGLAVAPPFTALRTSGTAPSSNQELLRLSEDTCVMIRDRAFRMTCYRISRRSCFVPLVGDSPPTGKDGEMPQEDLSRLPSVQLALLASQERPLTPNTASSGLLLPQGWHIAVESDLTFVNATGVNIDVSAPVFKDNVARIASRMATERSSSALPRPFSEVLGLGGPPRPAASLGTTWATVRAVRPGRSVGLWSPLGMGSKEYEHFHLWQLPTNHASLSLIQFGTSSQNEVMEVLQLRIGSMSLEGDVAHPELADVAPLEAGGDPPEWRWMDAAPTGGWEPVSGETSEVIPGQPLHLKLPRRVGRSISRVTKMMMHESSACGLQIPWIERLLPLGAFVAPLGDPYALRCWSSRRPSSMQLFFRAGGLPDRQYVPSDGEEIGIWSSSHAIGDVKGHHSQCVRVGLVRQHSSKPSPSSVYDVTVAYVSLKQACVRGLGDALQRLMQPLDEPSKSFIEETVHQRDGVHKMTLRVGATHRDWLADSLQSSRPLFRVEPMICLASPTFLFTNSTPLELHVGPCDSDGSVVEELIQSFEPHSPPSPLLDFPCDKPDVEGESPKMRRVRLRAVGCDWSGPVLLSPQLFEAEPTSSIVLPLQPTLDRMESVRLEEEGGGIAQRGGQYYVVVRLGTQMHRMQGSVEVLIEPDGEIESRIAQQRAQLHELGASINPRRTPHGSDERGRRPLVCVDNRTPLAILVGQQTCAATSKADSAMTVHGWTSRSLMDAHAQAVGARQAAPRIASMVDHEQTRAWASSSKRCLFLPPHQLSAVGWYSPPWVQDGSPTSTLLLSAVARADSLYELGEDASEPSTLITSCAEDLVSAEWVEVPLRGGETSLHCERPLWRGWNTQFERVESNSVWGIQLLAGAKEAKRNPELLGKSIKVHVSVEGATTMIRVDWDGSQAAAEDTVESVAPEWGLSTRVLIPRTEVLLRGVEHSHVLGGFLDDAELGFSVAMGSSSPLVELSLIVGQMQVDAMGPAVGSRGALEAHNTVGSQLSSVLFAQQVMGREAPHFVARIGVALSAAGWTEGVSIPHLAVALSPSEANISSRTIKPGLVAALLCLAEWRQGRARQASLWPAAKRSAVRQPRRPSPSSFEATNRRRLSTRINSQASTGPVSRPRASSSIAKTSPSFVLVSSSSSKSFSLSSSQSGSFEVDDLLVEDLESVSLGIEEASPTSHRSSFVREIDLVQACQEEHSRRGLEDGLGTQNATFLPSESLAGADVVRAISLARMQSPTLAALTRWWNEQHVALSDEGDESVILHEQSESRAMPSHEASTPARAKSAQLPGHHHHAPKTRLWSEVPLSLGDLELSRVELIVNCHWDEELEECIDLVRTQGHLGGQGSHLASALSPLARVLSSTFASVSDARVSVPALHTPVPSTTASDMIGLFVQHMLRSSPLAWNAAEILVSMDLFGNPRGAMSTLSRSWERASSLLGEPASGAGGSRIARAAEASMVVSSAAIGATVESFAAVARTVGRSALRWTGDGVAGNDWARVPRTNDRLGVASAGSALGSGLMNAVTGIVMDPIRGAREGGFTGTMGGILRGTSGVILRSGAGVLLATSHILSGVGRNLSSSRSPVPRDAPIADEPMRLILSPLKLFPTDSTLRSAVLETAGVFMVEKLHEDTAAASSGIAIPSSFSPHDVHALREAMTLHFEGAWERALRARTEDALLSECCKGVTQTLLATSDRAMLFAVSMSRTLPTQDSTMAYHDRSVARRQSGLAWGPYSDVLARSYWSEIGRALGVALSAPMTIAESTAEPVEPVLHPATFLAFQDVLPLSWIGSSMQPPATSEWVTSLLSQDPPAPDGREHPASPTSLEPEQHWFSLVVTSTKLAACVVPCSAAATGEHDALRACPVKAAAVRLLWQQDLPSRVVVKGLSQELGLDRDRLEFGEAALQHPLTVSSSFDACLEFLKKQILEPARRPPRPPCPESLLCRQDLIMRLFHEAAGMWDTFHPLRPVPAGTLPPEAEFVSLGSFGLCAGEVAISSAFQRCLVCVEERLRACALQLVLRAESVEVRAGGDELIATPSQLRCIAVLALFSRALQISRSFVCHAVGMNWRGSKALSLLQALSPTLPPATNLRQLNDSMQLLLQSWADAAESDEGRAVGAEEQSLLIPLGLIMAGLRGGLGVVIACLVCSGALHEDGPSAPEFRMEMPTMRAVNNLRWFLSAYSVTLSSMAGWSGTE
jgi:hypothetical protein